MTLAKASSLPSDCCYTGV